MEKIKIMVAQEDAIKVEAIRPNSVGLEKKQMRGPQVQFLLTELSPEGTGIPELFYKLGRMGIELLDHKF